jgi:hypothetical protein
VIDVVAWILAAEDGDLSGTLAQYGSLGALASALVAGQLLVLRYVLGPERARCDRLETEVGRLNAIIQEKTIPALVEATRVVNESMDQLRMLERERQVEQRERERERERDWERQRDWDRRSGDGDES